MWGIWYPLAQPRTQLSDFTFTFHFHALVKAMATHSSVLAWRIPGTGEPGGLPSMGSHRVGHDWRNLAAAAAQPQWLGGNLAHQSYYYWENRVFRGWRNFWFCLLLRDWIMSQVQCLNILGMMQNLRMNAERWSGKVVDEETMHSKIFMHLGNGNLRWFLDNELMMTLKCFLLILRTKWFLWIETTTWYVE